MPKNYESAILQLYARTPAPCRDYCGLTVTETDVILNIWQVSFGPHIYPKRKTCLISDYEHDKYLQSEVKRIYGENVCEYILGIHKRRNLQNLPTKCFLNVIKHLATRDIRNLSQTSTILFNRCNTDNIWKILFRKCIKRNPNLEEKRLAVDCGWKEALKQKFRKNVTQRGTTSKHEATKNNKTKEENSINRGLLKNINKKPPVNKSITSKPVQKSIRSVDINKNKLKNTNNTNQLNTTKSFSSLEKKPITRKPSIKVNQISSLININKIANNTNNKKSLPQVKSELKLNNINQCTKTAMKILVPNELKNLLVSNKLTINTINANLKPKNCIKNNLNNK